MLAHVAPGTTAPQHGVGPRTGPDGYCGSSGGGSRTSAADGFVEPPASSTGVPAEATAPQAPPATDHD
ncbi:hypothetical protein OG233_22140 [Streptomyces sp. NBC_01218]|uniref:hypothetical protein n=1 Tax=Streptomyces sp. NBC_01218 TaxID=2903780 RepID=UPI002E0E35A0|nr:hypothetical protein OG233_22140 [Streptomyces sp. NBC_01218]